MAVVNDANLNASLALIFRNGNAGVGLEEGTEPGLPQNQWIQVPEILHRAWAIRVADYAATRDELAARQPPINLPAPSATGAPNTHIPLAAPDSDHLDDVDGAAGWITGAADAPGATLVRVHGRVFGRIQGAVVEVDPTTFVQAPLTADMARAFYIVNQAAMGGIPAERIGTVMTDRWWATVTGLVHSTKNREFTPVPTPNLAGAPPAVDEWVATLDRDDSVTSALTAAAARAGSWRKTGHCTGGSIATGFPQKVLAKREMWSEDANRNTRDAANREATTCLYRGTHAIDNHAVLAAFAPGDNVHWSEVSPRFGWMGTFTPHRSVQIRLEPKHLCAGLAVVTDAYVAMCNVIDEKLAGLLETVGDAQTLKDTHDMLVATGSQRATWSAWFIDGYPQAQAELALVHAHNAAVARGDAVGAPAAYVPVAAIPWSQKEGGWWAICCELALVAELYFAGTTIAQSPSLRNAAKSGATESARTTWTALANRKRAADPAQLIMVYNAIKGASATDAVRDMVAAAAADRDAGIAAYNQQHAGLAAVFGRAGAAGIDAARVAAALTAALNA